MRKAIKKESAGMVDVGDKDITDRWAIATAKVRFRPKSFQLLLKQGSPKGDVLETAKIAGIMAAKSVAVAIPLCHPLPLDRVEVSLKLQKNDRAVLVLSKVRAHARTGVEMEALYAASIAALTVYDMMKWADPEIVVSDIMLLEKCGGKRGHYLRKNRDR